MAIVDDYAAISAEVRRIQAEQSQREKPADDSRGEPGWRHPMQATIAGDLLYRKLVTPRRQKKLALAAVPAD